MHRVFVHKWMVKDTGYSRDEWMELWEKLVKVRLIFVVYYFIANLEFVSMESYDERRVPNDHTESRWWTTCIVIHEVP